MRQFKVADSRDSQWHQQAVGEEMQADVKEDQQDGGHVATGSKDKLGGCAGEVCFVEDNCRGYLQSCGQIQACPHPEKKTFVRVGELPQS